ncbi:MAG: zinc ABC transporter substrate-binding protein [Candidatus Promineifilaceae bacterium]|nr:zinc ABC transporter substrate-binding protein [Candidatus Promineifilaceae bacterium]
MNPMADRRQGVVYLAVILLYAALISGCSSGVGEGTAVPGPDSAAGAGETVATEEARHEEQVEGTVPEILLLPQLQPADLDGGPLRVVATTSIIGDVVGQVGGGGIKLTTLIGPGQDPHSFEPAARDLTAVSGAHVIFVNGWDLEEGLADDLENISGNVPIVPISANIAPQAFAEIDSEEVGEHDHAHDAFDPHVWFSVAHVAQWTENAAQILSALDPAQSENYEHNAAAYLAELEALGAYATAELDKIPREKRYLVTQHDALGYLADDYGLTLLGTVIPSQSTLAEPSARDLTALIEQMARYGVCTIFTETTMSDALAQTAASELAGCEKVQVIQLYTGAVGPAGSGADSYIGMYRANVDAIVSGLK